MVFYPFIKTLDMYASSSKEFDHFSIIILVLKFEMTTRFEQNNHHIDHNHILTFVVETA